MEPSENPRAALIREIEEELGLTLDPDSLQPAHFAEEQGQRHIVLILYTSQQKVSEPRALDGQQWGWFSEDEAAKLDLAPMDRDLLARLFP